MTMIHVVVAEDHPIVRDGIANMLATADDITVVGLAADGAEAIELATRLIPDVVLMDLRMPNVDGVEATRRITELCPRTRVLVLTTYETDESILGAIEAGASGYILKAVEPVDIINAIRTTADGQMVLAAGLMNRIMTRQTPTPGARLLTDREAQILSLAAQGEHSSTIARTLYLSLATVKSHLQNAYSKLGVNNRNDAAARARELGEI